MTTMNISLPEALQSFVDDQVSPPLEKWTTATG